MIIQTPAKDELLVIRQGWLGTGGYGEIFQDLGTDTRDWVPGDQHYHYDLTVFVLDTMALKDSNVVINNGTPKGEAHITDIAQCNACDGGKLSFLETRE